MATYNYDNILGNAANQLSISDGLAICKTDIEDTLSRQSEILSILEDISLANSSSDFASAISGKLPMVFQVNDSLVEISQSNQFIEIYQLLDNDKQLLDQWSIQDFDSWDFKFSLINGEICDLRGNVLSYVSDSLESTTILNDYIGCAISSEDGTDILSRFASVSAVAASTGSPSSKLLIQQLNRASVLSGATKTSALAVVSQIYKTISDTSVNNDTGEIEFNSKEFYVQGFAYSSVINAVVNTASALLSAVLTVITPVIGIATSLLISGLKEIFSAGFIRENSYPVIDYSADNSLFAVPILQGKVSKSTVAFRISSLINVDNLWNDIINQGGCATLHFGYGDLIIWINQNDLQNLNYEFYISAYSADEYAYQFRDYSESGDYITFKSYYYAGSFGNTSMNASQVESYLSCLNGYRHSVKYDPLQGYPVNSKSYLGTISMNLATMVMLTTGAMTSVLANKNGNSDQRHAYIIKELYNSNTDYADLVNDIIPVIRADSGDFIGSMLYRYFAAIYSCHYTSISTSSVYMNILNSLLYGSGTTEEIEGAFSQPIFYLPDRGKLFVSPPQYSASAIYVTQAIILGTTLFATAAYAGSIAVRVKMSKVMSKKYLQVAMNQQAYMENPTDSNYQAYWKSLKNYNLLASFTGFSRLSTISGWETGDTSSSTVMHDFVYDKMNKLTARSIDGTQDLTLRDILLKIDSHALD